MITETLFQFHAPSKKEGTYFFSWNVPPSLPYFEGHFPGNPVLPAVAVLDATLEGARSVTGEKKLFFEKIKSGKFLNVILPETFLQLGLTPLSQREWEARWTTPDGKKIFVLLKFTLQGAKTRSQTRL